ncbi:ribonuclease H-like domain-containing protein [Mycena rosella]|uniref:Ribonuclease H-like domain-containing protein n=1 Tax=Mycena rosella TaxID=1033263 RepID=A0AAD7CUX1_MYCRO|nr:ribonuclease H-like domain-containing protein [Mycena rosella]
MNTDVTLIKNAQWFTDALASAIEAKCDVNGEKKAMAGHLRKCPHATATEKSMAAEVNPTKAEQKATQATVSEASKRAREARASDADDEGAVPEGRKKRKMVKAVEKSFKQSKLEVFKGLDIPLSAAQTEAIHAQFLRATQSANLPEAMDKRRRSSQTFHDVSDRIDAEIAEAIFGEDVLMCNDGWRSNAKDAVGGVSVSHKFKSILLDLICTNALSKDGESMARQFAAMIDDAEAKWGCNVIGFLTNNDSGSKKGRKNLGLARAWLLLFPCCSHQGQLILADHLREHPKAAQLMEELIEIVNWLNSKDKVRDIFDKTQLTSTGNILAYILPNLTRWTTHLIAALRFSSLKNPIRDAVLNKRDEIIAAHIGTESNRRKHEEMRDVALAHCATLEGHAWWDELDKIILNLEHICYLTNIAQSDHVRPDQFLLALAGLFLHFAGFSARASAEDLFVLALVLNPFQKLSRFGDMENIDPFIVSTEFITLYKRVKSRPPSTPRTPEEQLLHEAKQKQAMQSLSAAFMQYLSGTGPFASWENPQIRETYVELNSNNPIPVWEMFRTSSLDAELANFSLMLLYLVVNQAGLERSFSDFSNKKNKKRNRLRLVKMGQQSKVTRYLRNKQYEEGLAEKRDGRSNHSEEQVKLLLAVPRYAEALLSDTDDSDGEATEKISVVLRSKAAWRRQMAKWQEELREADEADTDEDKDESEDDLPSTVPVSATPRARRLRSWLPMTLAKLFGGTIARPIGKPARRPRVVSEEGLYMELLAAEYSGEEPDAGAQEGSDDNFEE